MTSSEAFRVQKATPLFPEALWNRPVSKRQAGTLLIATANRQHLAASQHAYETALASGIGNAKVLLPESLRKLTVGFKDALLLPETSNGSLGKASLPFIKSGLNEADALYIGEGIGSNSETIALLESLLAEDTRIAIHGPLLSQISHLATQLLERPKTLLILSFEQLRELTLAAKLPLYFSKRQGLPQLADAFASFHREAAVDLVLILEDQLIVSSGQTMSVTNYGETPAQVGVICSVFWLQQGDKPYEALTTACFIATRARGAADIKQLLSEGDV